MEFIVMARRGIGPVSLGLNRDVLRQILGVPLRTFRRNQFATADTDYFTSLGILVDYDNNNICNFITAVAKAQPTFQGRAFVGVPFNDCRDWFQELDHELQVDGTGLISRKLGISLYAEGALKNPEDPVEAVSVFAEGYYD